MKKVSDRQKKQTKMEILIKSKLLLSTYNLDMLNQIWDTEGKFLEDKVSEVVDSLKMEQKKRRKNNKTLIERLKKETTEYMSQIKFKEKQDYQVSMMSEGSRKGTFTYIQVVFRSKGNKKIIDYLVSKGWEIDRRYYNEDGSPSIFSSDTHGKVLFHNVQMIVLKHKIDEAVYCLD